jgi:chromosome segregation ATPase
MPPAKSLPMNLPSVIHTMAPGLRAPVSPAAFWRPAYLENSSRLEHVPFAFWLVDALRPRVVVQIGTADATAYFAICQAVERLGLETDCFALEGFTPRAQDESKRAESARDYHDAHYRTFSRWIPRGLARTSSQFSSGTVDLLHVSDTLAHDEFVRLLEEWRPKMSEQAVLLIDGTRSTAPAAAAPRIYRELRTEFAGFELPFGEGVGLVAIGSRPDDRMDRFLRTCEAEPDRRTLIEAFGRLGRACVDAVEAKTQEARANTSLAELRTYKIEVQELKTLGERAQKELRQKSDELLQIQQQVAAMAEQHALERGNLAERVSFLHELRDETKEVIDRLLSDLKGKSDELLQSRTALASQEQATPVIGELQSRLAARETEFTRLREQFDAQRTESSVRISELQAAIEDRRAALERTQRGYEEAEAARKDADARLQAELAHRERAEHVLAQSKARLEEQEPLLAQLRLRVEELDSANAARIELAERLTRTEGELASARVSLLGMQELELRMGQLAGVQQQFEAARSENSSLVAKAERERQEFDLRLAELAGVQTALEAARAEIAGLAGMREHDQLEMDSRGAALSKLHAAHSELKTQVAARNEVLAALQHAAAEREADLADVREALAATRQELALCRSERDAAMASLASSRHETSELRDAFADSRETVGELSEALDVARSRIEALETLHGEQMARAEDEISSVRQKLREQTRALGQARDAFEENRDALRSAQTTIESLQKERIEAARAMDERFQEIATLTDAIGRLHTEGDVRLQKEVARGIALQAEVTRQSDEKQVLAARADGLEAQVTRITRDKQALAERSDGLQRELAERFEEVAELTRALKAQSTDAEQANARARQVSAELERVQRSASWRLTTPLRVFGGSASRKGNPGRMNRRLVEESRLFDPRWYRENYPDVAEYSGDLLDHYLHIGWKEGKDPGPGFSAIAYLRDHPEAAKSEQDPLTHFLQFGTSGRSAS